LEGDYTEPLPTFNFALTPGSDASFLVRGAFTRAMTRPTVGELNPTQDIDVENGSISRGEPNLDPFLAWQYDLGLEYYFGQTSEGLFSITGFIKDVDNFIVPTTLTETLAFPAQGVPSQTYIVRTYKNGNTASISGFEVNLQSPFTFLPAPLSNFGGAANYTFTDSEFTDENGNTFSFPGASRDTYNLVLYYEQGGFSGRLAYNFRNDYLIAPSSAVDGSNALHGEGGGRLDLSLRYRFKSGIRISFDALNLTEAQSYKYYDIRQRYQNFEFEGSIYSCSVAYTF
jgi:TonB-dependent receptor